MDGREQPAGVVIPGAAPAYARRRKRPDEAADRLPRRWGASAPVRSPRSWTQPFARPDSLVSRHGLSTGLHPASIGASLAARSRSAAVFAARASPEPPFWAQTDSVQIMTWTRQIRLIWALVMPRMHARGGSYGRWMLLGDAGAVSLVSALRQAQEQCASPTGSSPRASPVFSSSSGRRTAVPRTCRLGHPVRTGGG